MNIEEHKIKAEDRRKEWARGVILWVRGMMDANYWRYKSYHRKNSAEAAQFQTAKQLEELDAENSYEFNSMGFIEADGPWDSGGGCYITTLYFQSFAISIGIENLYLVLRKSNEQCETYEGWKQYLVNVACGEIEPDECIEWGGTWDNDWGGMK